MPVLREVVDFVVDAITAIDRFQQVGRGIREPLGFKPVPAAFIYVDDKTDGPGSDGNKTHTASIYIQVIGTTEKDSLSRIEDLVAIVEDKLESDVSLGDKGRYSFGDSRSWEFGYTGTKESNTAMAICSFTVTFETTRGSN